MRSGRRSAPYQTCSAACRRPAPRRQTGARCAEQPSDVGSGLPLSRFRHGLGSSIGAIDTTTRDSRQGTARRPRSHRNNKDTAAELTAAQSPPQPSPGPIIAQLPSVHVHAARQPRPPPPHILPSQPLADAEGDAPFKASHVVAVARRTLLSPTFLPSRSRRRVAHLPSPRPLNQLSHGRTARHGQRGP